MKRILCSLLSILMLVQLPLALSAGAASAATVLYEDDFDYDGFSGLYDSTKTWRNECATGTDGVEYGALKTDMNAPTVQNGVVKFVEGDSLRFNWTQLEGIGTFDATKTYTFAFDVKVTDLGNNTGTNTNNREFYFAPGGYLNQIEMHTSKGIRAGDTWNKDLTAYTLNTVYSCTVVWDPTNAKITTTIKNGDTVVATGNRTATGTSGYDMLNKYTKFFVWRCEDGAIEVSDITFTDGTTTYTAPLSGAPMNASGIWEGEAYSPLLSTGLEPSFENGALRLNEKSVVSFNWLKVKDLPAYDSSNSYVFEYDIKLTDSGDGSLYGSVSSRTRALYVAFGGWYDLLLLRSADDEVVIGSSKDPYTDEKYLNKDLHIKMTLQGTTLSVEITDQNGNVLHSGARTKAEFAKMDDTHMRNLTLRCEDGALNVDNFKFSVIISSADSITELELADDQQAIYSAEVNYGGKDNVRILLGDTKLFALENNVLYVGAKQIRGISGAGTYQVKAWINPAQEMVIVEAVAPDGAVARRGCYTLAGGTAVSVYTDEGNTVVNEKVAYEALALNEYELLETEPTYTGFKANVYNLVTSFTDAADRAFAWTAKADFVGTDAMALKYRISGAEEWITADAVKETDTVAAEEYYKCDINGLAADTAYEYKIGKKNSTDETNDWSRVYTFKTAATEVEDFTFVAVGDTQGITWGGEVVSEKGFKYAHAAITEAMEENPDAAFLLHTGDVVESGSNTNQWNMYFKALGENGASVPHFATIGNHDTVGGGVNFDLHFNHPNNGGTAALDQDQIANITNSNLLATAQNADETIYSYNYGEAHFVVLNTGAYNHSEDRYLIEAQRQWLINDLEANKDAKWTIMLIHQAVHHRNGGNYDRQQLEDVIENYGIDLVLQGHSHLSTRTYPMKNGEIVTKESPDVIEQGIGTVYTTIGSTALNHDGATDSINDEEIYHIVTPAYTQPAYTTVEVKNNALHVVIKQVNGLVIDEFTINATGDAMIGDKLYSTVEKALEEATAGDVIKLKKNAVADCITVDPKVTLDLNGNTLAAGYAVGFKGSALIDSSEENTGKLQVAQNKLALDQTNGGYLPVYDATGEGYYTFSTVALESRSKFLSATQFAFSPVFETFVHEALMQGEAESGVSIIIRLNWREEGNYKAEQDFIYLDPMVQTVIGSYDETKLNYGRAFSAAFDGSEAGQAENVTVTAIVRSATGVEIAGVPATFAEV